MTETYEQRCRGNVATMGILSGIFGAATVAAFSALANDTMTLSNGSMAAAFGFVAIFSSLYCLRGALCWQDRLNMHLRSDAPAARNTPIIDADFVDVTPMTNMPAPPPAQTGQRHDLRV
jgi:predicted transporter